MLVFKMILYLNNARTRLGDLKEATEYIFVRFFISCFKFLVDDGPWLFLDVYSVSSTNQENPLNSFFN